MFTGIVEAVGSLAELKSMPAGYRIRIATSLAAQVAPGDSLAVNGVCLTAILSADGEIHADIGPETARVTTLGRLRPGQPVNLERALQLDGRLGGHLVQGHVDGIGIVNDIRPDADCRWVTVSFPGNLAPLLIRKGSIAVDGVSLTLAGLGEREFDLQIIPFTWQHTALSTLQPGDRVNLECDMIGKYVARSLELAAQDPGRKGQ